MTINGDSDWKELEAKAYAVEHKRVKAYKFAPNVKFGSLTTLYPVEGKGRRTWWMCRCDCGKEHAFRPSHIVRGLAKTCGCSHKGHPTHGMAGRGEKRSPEYRSWASAKNRCHNPKNAAYKNYGGRGIVMCEEWRNSFQCFMAYMGARPAGKYTLERINNNLGYQPGNCVWVHKSKQARNKRSNRHLTYNGITKLMIDWSKELNIKVGTLSWRVNSGWPIDRSLTEAVADKSGGKNEH